MKKNCIHKSKYFYGNELTAEEIKRGRISYRTLAKCFDAVLCNDITKLFYNTIGGEYSEAEQVNGFIDNSDELQEEQNYEPEVFQWFIISGNGAQILEDLTTELVYYLPSLDVYVWGVTHWGTSWDYVFTDIKVNLEAEA